MWNTITTPDIRKGDTLRLHVKNFPSSPTRTWQGTAVLDKDSLIDVGPQLIYPPTSTIIRIEKETPDPHNDTPQPALFPEPHQ